jgi:N6-adenosine-specific RNA methylase IME4
MIYDSFDGIPRGHYSVVYADPPWSFSTRGKRGKGDRNPDVHYPTMKLSDIKAIPVKEIGAKDSSLFLWTSGPWLKQAFEVIDAWGYKFSTYAFVWIKLRPGRGTQHFMLESDMAAGLGYHTMANMEIVLLGRRGHPPRVGRGIRQLVFAERREHSRKPEIVRDRIGKLMGDVTRIEMFARESHFEGWDSFGSEPAKFVESV